MTTLRQYINEKNILNYIDTSNPIDAKTLQTAENIIDNAIADLSGGLAKAVDHDTLILGDLNNFTFEGNKLTLNTVPQVLDYYTLTNVKVVRGLDAGAIYCVVESQGNILTLDREFKGDLKSNLMITQIGKAPFKKDWQYFKSIDPIITEAVALQYEYLVNEGGAKKLNKRAKKSESIGENYSYTLADSNVKHKNSSVAPLALELLDKAGYTLQTI